MNTKAINTDADYRSALKHAEVLMSAAPNSPEGDMLNAVVELLEDYESKHYRLDPTDINQAD